ncbi:SH3 domain-containing protein, partial [Kytococcus sp. HMSC28H12]
TPPTPPTTPTQDWTITDRVNYRTGPGTSYQAVGKLYPGTKVTGTKLASGWVKTTEGKYFWHSFGTPDVADTPGATTFRITQGVNVRAGAGLSHAILGQYRAGTTVKGTKLASGWVRTDRGYFWSSYGVAV